MADSEELKRLVEDVVRNVLGSASGFGPGLESHDLGSDSGDLMDRVLLPDGASRAVLREMRKHTPARIGVWRAGTRYKTETFLKARADHAVARDAVRTDVDRALIDRLGILYLESRAAAKEDFLINPSLGRELSDESAALLSSQGESGADVQIVVCDGLSSAAIMANLEPFLSTLLPGLKTRGLKVGKIIFINNGRVAIQNQVGEILRPHIALGIVGERPGLATAESMGVYITYNPSMERVEAERTMVSNIHRGGTPPQRAGELVAEKVKKIFDAKASGMGFKE